MRFGELPDLLMQMPRLESDQQRHDVLGKRIRDKLSGCMDDLRNKHPSLHQLLLQTAQPMGAVPLETAAQHALQQAQYSGGVTAVPLLGSEADASSSAGVNGKHGYRGNLTIGGAAGAVQELTVGYGPAATSAVAAIPLVRTTTTTIASLFSCLHSSLLRMTPFLPHLLF